MKAVKSPQFLLLVNDLDSERTQIRVWVLPISDKDSILFMVTFNNEREHVLGSPS